MNRKKETAVTVIAKRFLASILCLSMLLTAAFPDGGTAFAASLNQELPSAVSEGSVNKLSDSSSEEDTDSETMPSAEAADADDASKELQDVPLAPAVGGEPLSAEELAREEELFKKRAEAADDGFIRLDDLDGSDDGYRRGSYDNAFDSKLLAAELEKDDSGRKESPIVSEDTQGDGCRGA